MGQAERIVGAEPEIVLDHNSQNPPDNGPKSSDPENPSLLRSISSPVLRPGDGWKDGGMEGWREGGTDGGTDGRTEGRKDGRMEGWTDGRTDRQINIDRQSIYPFRSKEASSSL